MGISSYNELITYLDNIASDESHTYNNGETYKFLSNLE